MNKTIHNVPKTLKTLPQWMPYKLYPRENSDKFSKCPVVQDHSGRYIKASKTDQSQWLTFDKALEHVKPNGADGIGFCPNGSDITFIDLDGCVLQDSSLTPFAREIVDGVDGWVEKSVSGKGLHIVTRTDGLAGRNPKDMALGLEVMTDRMFVAMTGDVFEGRHEMPSEPVNYDVLTKHLGKRSEPLNDDFANLSCRDPNYTLEQARQAVLVDIDPDPSRDSWLRLGLALHFQFNGNPEALELWDEYSRRDGAGTYAGFNDLEKQWDGFKDSHKNPVTIATIIDMAKKKLKPEDVPLLYPPKPLFVDQPKADDYVLNGFVPEGLVSFSGHRGVGKTSIMAELICVITHVGCEPDHFLKVKGRRRIAYFTEDRAQLERVFTGKKMFGETQFTADDLNDWLKVVDTKRFNEAELRTLVEVYGDFYSNQEQNDAGEVVDIPCLVVFDTAAASFEVEDENNNSMWSRLISAIKQGIISTNASVWFIGHIAKSTRDADVTQQTARGGGSIEADVQMAGAIARDQATGNTVVSMTKMRIPTRLEEINFTPERHSTWVKDKWGDRQEVTYLTGTLSEGSREQRQQAKLDQKEANQEAHLQKIKDRMVVLLSEPNAAYSGADLRDVIGGSNDLRERALKELQEDGVVSYPQPLPEELKKHHPNKRKALFLINHEGADFNV